MGKDTRDLQRALGERLRHFRLKAGLTLSEVAVACGVEYNAVRRWENGENTIPYDRLVAFAKAVKTKVSVLCDTKVAT